MASVLWAWMHGYHVRSVLPRIAGTRSPAGMRVTIDRTGQGELVSWGCAIAVFTFGMVLVAYDLVRPHPQFGSDIALVSAGVGLIAAVRQVFVRRRFRKGTLLVNPWPIRLGSHVTAELHAFVKGEEAAPSARLECIEEAVTRSSRQEVRKTATIYSCDLPPAAEKWNRTKLNASWTFDVPTQYPSSFAIRGKQLQWRVVTRIPTNLGETSAEFPLLVVPEVVG